MNNLRWSNNLYVKETLNFRKEHPHIQYISISFTFHRRSRKHRFHGLLQYLMSAKYAICRSKRGDPSRVKEVQEKTGHKNPHTKRWKPYPLSNLCDLLFFVYHCRTVTPYGYYPLCVQASMLEITLFLNNFRTRERQGLQQYQPAYQRHQRQKGMAKLGIEGAMVAFDFPGFDTNVSFKTKLHDSKFNSSYEMTKPTYHLQILFIFFLLSQVSWWVSGKQKTHI